MVDPEAHCFPPATTLDGGGGIWGPGSPFPVTLGLVFSIFTVMWDRVGNNFNGRVPGYSFRWAIIGIKTKVSTFTNLKLT